MLSLFTESERSGPFESTPTIGGFTYAESAQDFDSQFELAAKRLQNDHQGGIDIKTDLNAFIKSPGLQDAFKADLLAGIAEEAAENKDENLGYFSNLYDQCSALYDNTVDDLYQESSRVGTLLPIKAVDLPLCIKSHIKATFNTIVKTKITRSPVIKKQIERTWVIDKKTKKKYPYPDVMYTEEWKDIYTAGIGTPLSNDPQDLPLFNFDIVQNLSGAAVPSRERITINIEIDKVYLADGTLVPLKKPITCNMADGSWVGGVIDTTVKDASGADVVVKDVISGHLNFDTGITSVSSSSGQIASVSFSGRISNEKNERAVTVDYSREDQEWHIEDGFRVDASFSLEKLDDYKALASFDLYKRTYNTLNDLLTQTEDNYGFDWLDEMFDKYDGVELNLLDFNPYVSHRTFDCDPSSMTVAMPSEWIANMLKFKIDRYLIDIADDCKLEGVTFVIYGNPRWVSLLNPNVKWVVGNGRNSIGGVKLNYSYGIMTSNDINVQVVSAKKLDAHKYDKLRFVAFPTSELTITFEKYKYTTHIRTSENSAYRDPDLPGGSQTYLLGTSRYKHICMQGIQGDMGFDNADFIEVA